MLPAAQRSRGFPLSLLTLKRTPNLLCSNAASWKHSSCVKLCVLMRSCRPSAAPPSIIQTGRANGDRCVCKRSSGTTFREF